MTPADVLDAAGQKEHAMTKTVAITIGVEGKHKGHVLAEVFGSWCAHERWSSYSMDGDEWTVTHVRSGLALPLYECVSRKVARATACALSECRVDGIVTTTQLKGDWRYVIEAVCGLALAEEKLPWVESAARWREEHEG